MKRHRQKQGQVIIKKYPNRRLYNTEISDYITLDDLFTMVKKNVDFVVLDAKTGADLTRATLAQIILERESKGANILPLNFLRQLIGFYDDSLHALLPHYLENTMNLFANNQENFRLYMNDYMNNALGNFTPFKFLEEITKQNINMFEQNMKTMFSDIQKDDQDS